MKELDWLTELIMSVFNENDNRWMTVVQIMNRVHGLHGGDSNSPEYRSILRRVNKLYANDYMDVKYVNRYKPAKYRMKTPTFD